MKEMQEQSSTKGTGHVYLHKVPLTPSLLSPATSRSLGRCPTPAALLLPQVHLMALPSTCAVGVEVSHGAVPTAPGLEPSSTHQELNVGSTGKPPTPSGAALCPVSCAFPQFLLQNLHQQ